MLITVGKVMECEGDEVAKLLISKLISEKSSDWSNANSLKLFTHPLHAAYSRCLLQVMPFAFGREFSNIPSCYLLIHPCCCHL